MAKEIVLAVMAAIFTDHDPEAAQRLLAPDYIQHNPAVPTGAAPVIGFIPALKDSGIGLTVHRVIEDGDMVAVHVTYDNAALFGAETLTGFDVFRVEDGKVAEHWDNLQPTAGPNPSGRTMVDGPVEIGELNRTEENRALVKAFTQDVLMGGNPGRITELLAPGDGYLQHNPMIGDGIGALGAALQHMAETGQALSYTDVHHVIAEGNFVLTLSEGAIGDAPTAFYDLFRVEDGRITEHWDAIAPIPAEMAHENGKF